MEIQYIGEHLWAGRVGQFAVYLSFFFALAAAIAFFGAEFSRHSEARKPWLLSGRLAFGIHGLAVVTSAAILFIIIYNNWFEYYYAWAHSSKDLPTDYLLSSFWEGQEGSFLLWMLWQVIIGVVLIVFLRQRHPGTLGVLSVVQFFLASMLLGLYVGGYKVGSSPFVLLRNEMAQAPIFQRADYLSFIEDGNGLNPLLQNYWMVIHPPVLFLGFASVLIPFSFAVNGLSTRNYSEGLKLALPWGFFAVASLGAGIMMGGAWAYESLTFGGYWAWDPVENASLVPWLILIAAVHMHLVYNKTGRYLAITYALYLFAFILVVYSTFLTRSGILGDTSVHAFTDLGMSGQLLVYLGVLTIPSVVLLLLRWRKMPHVPKEEHVLSREFWIFVGTMLLVISATQITFSTSIPVWNKVFGTNWAPPAEPIQHYNKWQLPIAVAILLLSSAALYLRYRTSDRKTLIRRLAIIAVGAAMATFLLEWQLKLANLAGWALLYATVFGIVASTVYLFNGLRRNLKLPVAALGHLGFAILLLGVLISSAKQQVISQNPQGIRFSEQFSDEQNLTNTLLIKHLPVSMGRYFVTYLGDSVAPPNNYYKVSFEVFDSASNRLVERFVLFPNAQINERMGLIANPDTRRYVHKDLYVHVSSVPDKSKQQQTTPTFEDFVVQTGDTFFVARAQIIVKGIQRLSQTNRFDLRPDDLAVAAELAVQTADQRWFQAQPIYLVRGMQASFIDDRLELAGLTFRLTRIIPEEKKLVLSVAYQEPVQDFIVLRAIEFPMINLVWLGTIVIVLSFLLSFVQRLRPRPTSKSAI